MGRASHRQVAMDALLQLHPRRSTGLCNKRHVGPQYFWFRIRNGATLAQYSVSTEQDVQQATPRVSFMDSPLPLQSSFWARGQNPLYFRFLGQIAGAPCIEFFNFEPQRFFWFKVCVACPEAVRNECSCSFGHFCEDTLQIVWWPKGRCGNPHRGAVHFFAQRTPWPITVIRSKPASTQKSNIRNQFVLYCDHPQPCVMP